MNILLLCLVYKFCQPFDSYLIQRIIVIRQMYHHGWYIIFTAIRYTLQITLKYAFSAQIIQ